MPSAVLLPNVRRHDETATPNLLHARRLAIPGDLRPGILRRTDQRRQPAADPRRHARRPALAQPPSGHAHASRTSRSAPPAARSLRRRPARGPRRNCEHAPPHWLLDIGIGRHHPAAGQWPHCEAKCQAKRTGRRAESSFSLHRRPAVCQRRLSRPARPARSLSPGADAGFDALSFRPLSLLIRLRHIHHADRPAALGSADATLACFPARFVRRQ